MLNKRTATNALILIICAAYLAQQLLPDLKLELLLLGRDYLQYSNEWYRLITVALTHAGLMHLGFNMYSLYILGTPIEQAYGRNKFLIIFYHLTFNRLTCFSIFKYFKPRICWSIRRSLWFIRCFLDSRKNHWRQCSRIRNNHWPELRARIYPGWR